MDVETRAIRVTGGRALAAAAVALLAMGAGSAAAQVRDCGGLPSLQVTVTDEPGTKVLPAAMVVARWTVATELSAREMTGADGRVRICAPADVAGAVLWAEFGEGSSRQAVVTVEAGETREVELRILSAAVSPGRIIGRVYDAVTDDPIRTAAISITGRSAVIESNRQGGFVLSGVPAGARELEVRRLGYAPLRHAVSVTRGHTTEVEIGLVPAPAELEPLVVTATRLRKLEIKGFYERKRWGELTGNGYFFGPEYIERWRPSSVGTLVRMNVPGISPGFRNRRFSITGYGFANRPCRMNYYVDGIRIKDAFPLLMIEVAAVEVYKGPASLAAGFGGSDARCGAVVVWTK